MLQELLLYFFLWNGCNVSYSVAGVVFLALGDSGTKM